MADLDSSMIPLLTLTVAVIALLFGPGLAIRVFRSVRDRVTADNVRRAATLDYLRTACVFMDGLPLFLSETWNWGPSVPNYAAGGRFPASTAPSQHLQSVAAVVGDALAFYVSHSQKQGRPYPSEHETLGHFSEIPRFSNGFGRPLRNLQGDSGRCAGAASFVKCASRRFPIRSEIETSR